MDYFSKFLRTTGQPPPKTQVDHAQEFHNSWNSVKNTLLMPDERQLTKGINSTDVPVHLRSMVDSLVWESTRIEEGGTGACLEYLLKNDVLGTLVRLSESDRPAGIQAEVLRAVSNMVVLLDEQFLVHSAVHKAVLRLLRNCVGDDLQEQLDGRSKLMGAARNVSRAQPSEHEEDLVHLLCILCSRIRTYRELLMIFFHDKHWYRSEPLFSVEEDNEEDEEDEEDEEEDEVAGSVQDDPDATLKGNKTLNSDEYTSDSPIPSHTAVPSTQPPGAKKLEYEFLLFNYLLRFVHREGHIGEFARAGLLFLMDVAMSPGESETKTTESDDNLPVLDPINDAALALAEYILDGDFSEVLGAGLGAVYSLLPTKLGFFRQSVTSESDNAMKIGGTGLAADEEREQLASEKEKNLAMGIEDARSPEFKAKIDHLLKLLMFLQDVLRRNVVNENVNASALVGTAIVQSILDAVRRIFLENVLYPSILECSDTDGSAVAVMSYIEVMVRTLREGPLANLLVDFLISEDNDDPRSRQRPHSSMLTLGAEVSLPPSSDDKRMKHRRRQSSAMILLEMEAPASRKPSDYFTSMGRFTLKDLLLTNLRSKSQPTATTALQLFQTMLLYHPRLTIERILIVIPDSFATAFPNPAIIKQPQRQEATPTIEEEDEEDTGFKYPDADEVDALSSYLDGPLFVQPEITYSTHEREMGLYLALVSRVDPSYDSDSFSTGYDHYLHDALVTIQSQPVYWECLEQSEGGNPDPRLKHRLNVNDPIISLLLESLTTFFSNTPDFNIGLTGVFATLATHPDRSLAGWLTFNLNDSSSPNKRFSETETADNDKDGDDRSFDFEIEENLANDSNYLPAATLNESTRPVMHTIFHGLVTQLEQYRHTVDNFDKFLLERRQGLLFSENLTDALNLALDITNDPQLSKPVSEVVQKPKTKPKPSASSSFVAFLTPKKSRPAKPAAPPEPSTPPQKLVSKSVSASPFGAHYQHTGSVTVEPFVAPVPSSGPWTPAKSKNWPVMEDDVFGSGWMEKVEESHQDKTALMSSVTLSQLLDNVVILEENIKELVAIIHARRSLGIDSLRYL